MLNLEAFHEERQARAKSCWTIKGNAQRLS